MEDVREYLQQARDQFCRIASKYTVAEHLELRTEVDSFLIAYDKALEIIDSKTLNKEV